jgi:hypothetical protein
MLSVPPACSYCVIFRSFELRKRILAYFPYLKKIKGGL